MALRSALFSLVIAVGVSGCGDEDDPPKKSGGSSEEECPAQDGEGTEHQGTIDADETWSAEDGPHIVTFDVNVRGSTLTIEPCATVRIDKGYHFTIGATSGDEAAIVARGEPERPVIFEPSIADEPWGSIRVFPTGRLDLEEAILRGGGDPDTAQNSGGIIVATGPGGNSGTSEAVRVVNVTVEDSGGFGVNLQSRAVFSADSTELTVRGSGSLPPSGGIDTSFPLYVDGPAVSSIPLGDYTQNAIDEILVATTGGLLDKDVTFHQRGVPYRMVTGFGMAPDATIAEGSVSTLTIEAGVTLRFPSGAPANVWGLDLGTSNGGEPENIWPVRLIAEGTEDAPIVLTSAEEPPAPGDWAGIEWHGGPPDGNVMRFVRVEYAGGDSGTVGFGCGETDNDAALIIRNWRPDDAFIQDSTFSDSAGGGIVSGWLSDEEGPDFTNNTFSGIGNACEVSRWADGNGSCPGDRPICFSGS